MSQGKIGDSFESGLLRHDINLQNCIDEKIWINGVFDLLPINTLSTQHIYNCLAFLQSNSYALNDNKSILLPKALAEAKTRYMALFEEELTIRNIKSLVKKYNITI